MHVPFPERLTARLRNDPMFAASLGLLVLLFGGGGIYLLVHWLRLGAVGDACRGPQDCRSDRCVSVSAYRPMAVDPNAPEWEQKMRRSLNEALDPLGPKRDGLGSYVPIAESYCTRECQSDADCPSGFACGEGKSYVPTLLGKGFVSGTGAPVRICARR